MGEVHLSLIGDAQNFQRRGGTGLRGRRIPAPRRRVEALGGSTLPLPDGTFLVGFSDRLIVRFDGELRSRSPLMNRELFVVDLDTEEIMRRVSGRPYELPDGSNNYQAALDDVYHYVMQLRGASSNEGKSNWESPAQ